MPLLERPEHTANPSGTAALSMMLPRSFDDPHPCAAVGEGPNRFCPCRHPRADLPHLPGTALLDRGERARYRWMLGHQAAFAIWQHLARRLNALRPSSSAHPGEVRQAAELFDAYSALLIYCGSCDPHTYQAAIRPEMARAHPAFSGHWAADHRPLPALLHQVRAAHPPETVRPLLESARRNRKVHMAVASRLVPAGASLLTRAGHTAQHPPTLEEQRLYDGFFRVHRAPVCATGVATQLADRLTRIDQDLDRCFDPIDPVGGFTGASLRTALHTVAQYLPEPHPSAGPPAAVGRPRLPLHHGSCRPDGSC
jgi:hypothetical protein